MGATPLDHPEELPPGIDPTGYLRWRVACECKTEGVGFANSYPDAWTAMNAWKQAHNWQRHPSRTKTTEAYDWSEYVQVYGDRSRFDGLGRTEG